MYNLIIPLVAFIVSAVAAVVLLVWLLALCHKRGLYDLPSSRKVHQSGVPRLGGVVFVPAMLIGAVGAALAMYVIGVPIPSTLHPSFISLCFSGMLLYFIGVVDDLFSISARIKFGVQLLVATSFPVSGLCIDSLYGFLGIYALPLWFSWTLTIFLMLLIINAVNLIDGIDGLAGSLVLMALGIFGFRFETLAHVSLVVLCASLGGAICAFLFFNIAGSVERRTKTFMGDSGSLFLGVVLGYLIVLYAQQDTTILPARADGLVVAYTAILVPCFDLCRVALSRLSRRQGIFVADKTHLHHKLMDAGFTMRQALVAIVLLQAGFVALNLLMDSCAVALEWIVLADVFVFVGVNVFLSAKSRKSS